jgi:D-glycero-D-manno-heptose 1,7-bisphosphate phosphatase
MGIGAVSRPAVFLDRDGVLVEEVFYPKTGEREAPLRPEDVRLIPGAAAAARGLARAGYALVLVSNQGGYAKGKTTLRSLWMAHERFVKLLAGEEVVLDAVFYAFGHPNGSVPHFSGPSLERKPSPYNLLVAAAQLDLDLAASWLVGDRETDLLCGEQAGVSSILVGSAWASAGRKKTAVANLAEAARIILERSPVPSANHLLSGLPLGAAADSLGRGPSSS